MVTVSKRVYALILVFSIIIISISACALQSTPQEQLHEVNPFTSFHEIPGITAGEIEDIERLLRENESFSYGMILSIEAFVKRDGEIGGYAALFCEWLAELFGIPFEIEIYPMNEVLGRLGDKELDFSGVVMTTEENQKRFFMTDVIAERQFVTLRLVDGKDLNEILMERPIRYAFMQNTPSEAAVAAVTEPGTYEPVWVSNAMEAYQLIKEGEADALIMSSNNDALFINHEDVIIEYFYPLIFNPVSMATANPDLEPIISAVIKAQQNGANDYFNHLFSRAYQDYLKHKLSMRLTDEERAFLADASTIPVAAQNTNYPVSFFDHRSNQWQGIFFDLLDEITKLTGLEFDVIHDETAPWAEINDLLISGEAAFTPQVGWTREREEFYIWSDVVLYNDYFALISHSDHRNIVLNDILNERIGLIRGTVFEYIFNRWFPTHRNTVIYETQDLAFEGLKSGEVDLVMSTQRRLMYLTHYQELPNFKANLIFNQYTEISFGFNKNETTLLSIIDKALILTDYERIIEQWTEKTYDFRVKVIEERQPWLISALVAFSLILVLLVILHNRNRKVAEERSKLIENISETSIQLELALNKANEDSRAKSNFLANMSHEMRTPLNAIIGMTLIGKRSKNTEEKGYALNKIDDASTHLLGIVNDILDMAKIEANKLELFPVEFNFKNMVDRVMGVVNFRAEEKKHNLSVNIDKKIPKYIFGDDQRLSQVIANLLTNAFKFTPEGGNISLDISLVGRNGNDCELRTEVTDSGIGISKEQQEKLFEIFEQADNSTSREYGGTGLGLAISKRIVEMMDGEIWIESEIGKGAKFIFTVHVESGQKSDAEHEAIDGRDAKMDTFSQDSFEGKRLLIAEDVEINREIMVALLEDSGLIIDCAETGKEAVDMVAADPEKYDIVFMDLQMPQMNGLEAARLIRALPDERYRKLPIIAMTANVFKDDIEACLEAGMNDHISKPLDYERVLKVLAEYLA